MSRPVLHYAATLLICLALYGTTMPRAITLEDAGLFQMVCYLGGISHPPGYPLFTSLCNVLVQYPHIVNGNLVSALFGAVAAMVFHAVVFDLTRDRLLAWVSAIAWAVSINFWTQAIIVEVYTLAALMFVVCWWLLRRFESSGEARWWFLACLAFGLSLSNHWPLMLLSTPALLAVVWPARRRLLAYATSPKMLAASVALVSLGLLPYLTLFLREPGIAVFGGIDSIEELLRYVTRSAYSDDHAIAGMADRFQYAGWVIGYSLTQWGYFGAPLVVLGVVAATGALERHTLVALLLIWLSPTLGLVLLLNFEYSEFYKAVFKPYPIIAMSAVAMMFAMGTRLLVSLVRGRVRHAALVLASVALLGAAVTNFPRVDRSDARLVENYARTILSLMPEGAVLFLHGDNYTGPIGYLHYVEGVRPDLEVRDWENLVFDNRLSSPYAPVAAQLETNERFILDETRPVFATEPVFTPRIDYGAFYEFNPTGSNGYGFPAALGAYVDLLVAVYHGDLVFDAHEKYFVFQALLRFSRQYVGFALAHRGDAIPKEIGERVALLQQTFPGKLMTLQQLVPLIGTEVDKNRMLEAAAAAEQEIPDFASRASLALFYRLVARIHLAAPVNEGRAIEYLSLSIAKRPAADNESVCLLYTLHEQRGDEEGAAALQARFDDMNCVPEEG